jgi:hypothetical protein
MKAFATFLVLLSLGLGYVSDASAQSPPLMTIKIFNDDPNHHIFPVLTTGQGAEDIWLQAIFKVPEKDIPNFPYPRNKSFRIYINPSSGIGPGQNVAITIPLYTQLVPSVDPKMPNQYIDWWNGGTILLYSSDTATRPRALTDDLTNRPSQQPVPPPINGAVFPTCTGNCQPSQPLQFFSDDSDLPKADPSQLLEYTLGARVALTVKNPATDPPNALDLANVDFDVSYVNVAYLPAAMGPYQNNQVGYVGTPQHIDTFTAALDKFLTDFPGWPQFVRTYPTPPTPVTVLKLASPLEIFARLSPPSEFPPPDLTPPPHWPDQLWAPIQALRTNWLKYAGKVNNSVGACRGLSEFCDAIIDVKTLMMANFENYKDIFPQKCTGTPITLTDDVMIAHVYGWAPFTESATSPGGCPPTANLLENTPGYSANNFAKYLRIKEEFDKLNYGKIPGASYVFNPWVLLIHNQEYVNAPNVYAYSVDDAVGNIQAEGTGFIIDVGSTQNLENPMPAEPPINISIGFGGPQPIQFTHYRVCENDPSREKPINPNFASFIISANDPANCPIFFRDNKSPPQFYTFTITQPPPFTVFTNPADAKWTEETARVIDCSKNTGMPPFQQSSKVWCCEKLAGTAGNGVFAYTTPEPHSAHATMNHFAVTHIAEQKISNPAETCNMGK